MILGEGRLGGIVLAGGRSARMGRPKALLPIDGQTLLARVVDRVSAAASPVVVVAADDSTLPPLPSHVRLLTDRVSDRGPLEGVRVGLDMLAGEVDACFVTGCDFPRLEPAMILGLRELLGDHSAAVPLIEGFAQPLCAVYRPALVPLLDQLLDAGERRLLALVEAASPRLVTADELRPFDPHLRSFCNLNHPADYERLLADEDA